MNISDLQQIKQLLLETEQLKNENISLRNENFRLNELINSNKDMLKLNNYNPQHKGLYKVQEDSDIIHQYSNTNEKISLFKSLFCSREDVYAVRWEN